mmetsp:Transcript_9605/g.29607  ORF Transcript_9605/g.29607 Transcript_9605/m.29607 type:complete len:198 (-) Transcript_9605:92-685(-)
MSSSKVDCKVVLLGQEAVGKTCLVERFLFDTFQRRTPTVGAAFSSKEVTANGRTFTIGLWDTAGQERFESMSRVYYRSAKAALVCYDVTNMKSWEKVKFWVEELVSNEPTCQVYILGNMMDKVLEDGQFRLVSKELVEEYAAQVNARTFETSAKTNMNVDHVFEVVAEDFVNRGTDKVVEYSPVSLENDEVKQECPC